MGLSLLPNPVAKMAWRLAPLLLCAAARALELPGGAWLRAAAERTRPPLIARPDGVSIRFGTVADAGPIRDLWRANAAPNALGPAWSTRGVERSFARRVDGA